MRDVAFWQAFLQLDLPPAKAREVLERLGPHCVSADSLRGSPILTPEQREVVSREFRIPPDVSAVGLEQPEYPEDLRLTRDPTPALLVRGDIGPPAEVRVAIVGTRKASAYGRTVTRMLASECASAGVTVVSGGAHGIDAEAHEAAIQAGGRSIAVLGSGLDRPYPAANRSLFSRIAENGAVVSQFALGTKPDRWRFPMRNFVIAGLCRAVVVVEAPEASGSLLTAHIAADEGRHVFATPASIDNVAYAGSFRLINDGATLLYSPDQLLSAIGVERVNAPKKQIALSEIQERILTRLNKEPELADNLSEEMGLSAGDMLSELTNLELEGLIARSGGGYVRL